jgi:hypothetical protein
MLDEAYQALEAIRRGEPRRLLAHERWVAAFLACRWAIRSDDVVVLTESGLTACRDLARDRIARAA